MRSIFFVFVLGCAATACNAPSQTALPGPVQRTTPTSATRITTSDQLPARLGGPVELHGVAGVGKNGNYLLVDGEGVDLLIEGRSLFAGDEIGKTIVVRGVLRHTGPTKPSPASDGDPIASAMETYYLENASAEFVNEPPPALASQVGKFVLVRGILEIGKSGPLIVTEVGPVYFKGDIDPALKDRIGARVFAAGTLEHFSAPPQLDGDEQVARVTDYYFLRNRRVNFVDRQPREP